MKCWVFFSILVSVYALPRFANGHENRDVTPEIPLLEPEAYMTTLELVLSRGYPAEPHSVQTDDGYILEIHRIPYGKSGPSANRQPIFIQHGLMSSSFDFVANFGNQSLGYMLADIGFDVWMGNYRGNIYSRQHATLNPDTDDAYWKFNWDEMAAHDLPAMLNYVLGYTGFDKIFYIGHSMGTTTFFAFASTYPEWNDKIEIMVALAPVATVGSIRSPVRFIAPYVDQLEFLVELFDYNEFLPNSGGAQTIAGTTCVTDPLTCESFIFNLCGYDVSQLNSSRLPVYMSHYGGASTETVLHYAQMVNSKTFQYYDYGEVQNMIKYGQATPPLYDLSKVRAPVILYWAENDWLADPEDVASLAQNLTNLVENYRIPYDAWNHVDTIWAMDAELYQNTKLADTLLSYVTTKV